MRNERYRNEWKYLIHEGEAEALISRLSGALKMDEHSRKDGYTIRSLYFDDYFRSAYENKLDGLMYRKKYRIRIYNYQDGNIKLERKKKAGSYICKEDAGLTKEEYEKIVNGEYEFLRNHEHPLLREFYVECICHVLRPCVIVDYERKAYMHEQGTVRITFDRHVRAASAAGNLFDPNLPAFEVLQPGKLVMEVKFTEFLPNSVKVLLPPGAFEFTAVSKYVLCYDKMQYLFQNTYWEE